MKKISILGILAILVIVAEFTYTTHNNARSLIRKIDRDELLAEMVKSYLNT